MLLALSQLSRYIVCGQVTKRPIFAFVSTHVRPNAALEVFSYEDDYSFGILQSETHWKWFISRCSTMKSDPRYTSNTVWDSFPWPQEPTAESVRKIADAAVSLRTTRDQLALRHNLSLRDLYRSIDLPGKSPLKDSQAALDEAVREAYGAEEQSDTLAFLLELNARLAEMEQRGERVRSAGLPDYITDRARFVTADSLTA
jgi:hypothetical protein